MVFLGWFVSLSFIAAFSFCLAFCGLSCIRLVYSLFWSIYRSLSIKKIFLLLDKTSFQPKPRNVSSLVIPSFNEVIIATLLIHIDTLSLLMSHFFENFSMFLPINHPPSSDVISLPFFIPSQMPHLYLRLLHLNHCRFVLVTLVLTLGLRLTHLLWHPPPRRWSCHLPLIFPLPFGKVLVPLVTHILFIIS